MKAVKPVLTAKERARFDACNKQIRDGLQSCFDTGAALAEVRDGKLYREDYKTFEEYCRETFDVSRAHAYRLIAAADIKELSPIGDKIENEVQARALAAVPQEQQAAVVESVRGEGSMTARAITEKASKSEETQSNLSPKGDKKVPVEFLGADGYAVPEEIQELWKRAEAEAKKGRSIMLKAKSYLRACEETNDIIFAEFKFQDNITRLTAVFDNFGLLAPYAVCTTCQGRAYKNCGLCKGRGFLSAFAYKMYGDDEVKKMRAKQKRP